MAAPATCPVALCARIRWAVWHPDPAISGLRRQVLRRAHIVRQRTRWKNQMHVILHRNLIPRCPAADLFGHKGRVWLASQALPPDELSAATALLRQSRGAVLASDQQG